MKSHDITFIFYTLCINTWTGIMCSPCALTQTNDRTAGLSWMRKANMMVAPRISFHFREQRPNRCHPSGKKYPFTPFTLCVTSPPLYYRQKNLTIVWEKKCILKYLSEKGLFCSTYNFPSQASSSKLHIVVSARSTESDLLIFFHFQFRGLGLFCGKVLSSCVGSPASGIVLLGGGWE